MRTLQPVMLATVMAGVAITATPSFAQPQPKFPTKPIRLVVGLSPGGTLDTLARITGQKMSENWGQPVVVENRPGGSTVISASLVAKSAPDGYTLLVILGSFPAAAATMPKLPYDPLKDFAGVAQFGYGTGVLVVSPALGVKSTKELIALAREKPGQIIGATIGAGSVASVPEPSTFALLGLGGILCLAARRRRKAAKSR